MDKIFECQNCGTCCKGYGGIFVKDKEVDAISSYLGIHKKTFLAWCCDPAGNNKLMLRTAENGSCILWDKVCTIHPVKPVLCRTWPYLKAVLQDPNNLDVIKNACPGLAKGTTYDQMAEAVNLYHANYSGV
ncbi:MAG: YkgJ family cysteine cluster protein [Pseudomonadota bacterium]